jgi:hypothetical protein
MDDGWVEQIRRNLEAKSSEELRQIWEKNDRNEWSDDAFIAIQRILEARGENPGPQGPPTSEDKVTKGEAAQAGQSQRPGCVTAFVILMVVGAVLTVLQQGMAFLSGSYWDMGSTIGAVVALFLAAIYSTVAAGLWQLKNWARLATLVLLGLNLLLLFGLLVSGMFPAVIGLLINGYCMYWFAVNKKHFEAGG